MPNWPAVKTAPGGREVRSRGLGDGFAALASGLTSGEHCGSLNGGRLAKIRIRVRPSWMPRVNADPNRLLRPPSASVRLLRLLLWLQDKDAALAAVVIARLIRWPDT